MQAANDKPRATGPTWLSGRGLALLAGGLATAIMLWSLRWYFSPHLLAGHHSEYHALRVLLVADLWRNGQLIPRWVPELAGGLGYPLFIYYGWLAYAFAAALEVLGISPVTAMNTVVITAALWQAAGSWRLGREVGCRAGGFVAWALFALAPYQLADLYVRGNYPEFIAGSFGPWALFAMLRFVAGRGRPYLLACAALLAAIVLCHNISGLTLGATIAAVGLLFALTRPAPERKAGVTRALLAPVAGVFLSALFWLPIVFARGYVGLANDFSAYLDYRQHFLYLHQLVATAWGYGFSVPGPDDTMPLQLGLAQVASLLLVPIAVALSGRHATRRRARLAGIALLAALLAFLTTVYAAPIWSVVSPLALLQFPWRLHLPGTLVVAVAAAFAVRVLVARYRQRFRKAGPAVALSVCAALGLAAGSLRYCQPSATYVCDETCLRKLLAVGYFTTSIQDEFRPIWASDLKALAQIMRSQQVSLGDLPLPEVKLPSHDLRCSFSLQVQLPKPGELRLPIYWFPGWSVRSDGAALASYPCAGTGILCAQVGAGAHSIAAAWRPTLVYHLGVAISLATLAALVAWMLAARVHQHHREGRSPQ